MRIFDVDEVAAADLPALGSRLEGEIVEAGFTTTTSSTILFTDRRIVTMQLQLLLSERIETTSFSYRSMRQFSLTEGAGSRSEIRIWIGADPQPLHLRANEGADLTALHRLLAQKLA